MNSVLVGFNAKKLLVIQHEIVSKVEEIALAADR